MMTKSNPKSLDDFVNKTGTKLFILMLMLTLIVGVSVYVFIKHKENIYQQNVQKITEMQDQIDQAIMSGEYLNENTENESQAGDILNPNSNQNIEEGDYISQIDKVLSGNNDIDINDLKVKYNEYDQQGDYMRAIEVLEEIYDKTKDIDFLYLIVDELVKMNRFDEALKYIEQILDKDPQLENISMDVFFYILFNSLDHQQEDIERLIKLMDRFKSLGRLGQIDYDFYMVLINILQNNIDQAISQLDKLDGSDKYSQFYQQINNNLSQYEKYRDVPRYYLKGLISLSMFKNGYFKIAEKLANEALSENNKYILSYQILAYSSFVQGNYQDSNGYLKELISLDYQNKDHYNFFRGLSNYWDGDYRSSIIYLSQVEDSEYALDIQRYMALGYYQIKDFNRMMKHFNRLFDLEGINEYDYYTFFDIVFYEPWSKDQDFDLFKDHIKTVVRVLRNCSNSLDNNDYICKYGMGGFRIANDQLEYAYRYLKYLVDRYPRDYIYTALAKYYENNGNEEKARSRYIQALRYAKEDERKLEIRQEIIDMFN